MQPAHPKISWLHFGDSQKELQWLPAPQGCPECNLFFQIVKSGLWLESLMYRVSTVNGHDSNLYKIIIIQFSNITKVSIAS